MRSECPRKDVVRSIDAASIVGSAS